MSEIPYHYPPNIYRPGNPYFQNPYYPQPQPAIYDPRIPLDANGNPLIKKKPSIWLWIGIGAIVVVIIIVVIIILLGNASSINPNLNGGNTTPPYTNNLDPGVSSTQPVSSGVPYGPASDVGKGVRVCSANFPNLCMFVNGTLIAKQQASLFSFAQFGDGTETTNLAIPPVQGSNTPAFSFLAFHSPSMGGLGYQQPTYDPTIDGFNFQVYLPGSTIPFDD